MKLSNANARLDRTPKKSFRPYDVAKSMMGYQRLLALLRLFGLSALARFSAIMNYLFFWILGFGTLWAGLNLFDDEVLLIVSLLIGSALVLLGLLSAPMALKAAIEIALVASLFHVCMECVGRSDRTRQ